MLCLYGESTALAPWQLRRVQSADDSIDIDIDSEIDSGDLIHGMTGTVNCITGGLYSRAPHACTQYMSGQ